MRVGKYKCPEIGIDKSVDFARRIHEKCGKEATRETIAENLNMSLKGGGFITKIAALEIYGLAETGGNKVKLTTLAESCIFPVHGDEDTIARTEAVKRVGIFTAIYGECGENPTVERIKAFLVETGGVDRSKAENQAQIVSKLFKQNVEYTKSTEKPRRPISVVGVGRREIKMPAEPMTEVFDVKVDDVYMQVPRTSNGIAMAKKIVGDAFQMLEEQIKQPKKEVKKD